MQLIESISEFHRLLSLPAPLHPLVSVINVKDVNPLASDVWAKFAANFYSVSIKHDVTVRVKYGQQYYDFDKGIMSFSSPKQVQAVELDDLNALIQDCGSGWMLLFHPDFLYGHPLSTTLKSYGFFSYEFNEALHLSEKEEQTITEIFTKIEREYQFIDGHTQNIILTQIELMLQYCDRFYQRQFITRKKASSALLVQFEKIVNQYFDSRTAIDRGLPSLEDIASQLSISPRYMSDMLRTLTGQSAQQHIQEVIIEKAKEKLSTTSLSVAEIAYALGFERPQSFNKLFKNKTNRTPLEFRASFN
ncbi:AraC family transcriptional regulator [Fibrisoma montanum]|uniref:AraC family transcriptional regulator n=1 Tax=Fibrisoma montanum TaxID=2305895 RepID=A0A418LZ29_9BACT|nr:AraC family transcriptional regulator [Fibrisoma montanum]RIV18627.1 AraC family transcriptional regulator [Fibrisoma montanum]